MALKSVPGIDLESLPEEADRSSRALAQRAQDADRLTRESAAAEMLRLERLKKYGPKSEKFSAGQIELLELSLESTRRGSKRNRGLFGAKAPHEARACQAQRPARASATARGDHCRGGRGEALRVLRRGALPHWLRGIGGARDRAGPLLCARDQARETGLPQMPGGRSCHGCGRGPQKGQALRRCGSSMCSSRNIILSERGSKCRYILNPTLSGFDVWR
jgi:hypothetical protein